MNDEQKLTIAISAIDNASAVLKQIANNATTTTNQISQGNEKAGTSFGTLVGGILTSQAAYQALMTTYEDVKGFFESSFEDALKASGTMVQVQVDVNNAGLSYNKLAPQIAAVAQQNEKLGFSQEDTQLSMGKLILATGNYTQAQKMNHLAMDLSVAKNIDLNSATVLLQQVMAGNTRVLKAYGISIDGAATSADALNLIQQKVGGSADALAGTPLGHMREMQAQWEEMKIEVGNAFMPVLEDVFSFFEAHLPEITVFLKDLAAGLVTTAEDILFIGQTTGVFEILKVVLGGVVQYFQMVTGAIQAVADALHGLIGDTEQYANSQIQLSVKMKETLDNYNKLHQAHQVSEDDFKQLDAASQIAIIHQTDLAEKTGKLSDATAGASLNFNDIENHIQKADNAVIKHSDAVAKLSTDYDKMKTAGATDLADLSDQFTTKMASINDAISKTQKSIADLTNSFNQTQTDDTAKVAESIVASEQKIADIKKQLAESTSVTQTENLNEQLVTEQKNYDSSLAFRTANVAAMSAAEARGQETDLQRAIDDYNTKKQLDLTAYNEKLQTLNQELKDKQKEADDEKTLYQNKVNAINKVLDAGNAYFTKLSNDRISTTTKEVDAEIAQFQALTAAIGQMKSASSSALSTISVPTLQGISLPTHEAGGFINAPRGTTVPILAHGGEQVIPAEQVGNQSGSGLTVVINNPTIRDNNDLTALTAQIEQIFRSVLINNKIAHI